MSPFLTVVPVVEDISRKILCAANYNLSGVGNRLLDMWTIYVVVESLVLGNCFDFKKSSCDLLGMAEWDYFMRYCS